MAASPERLADNRVDFRAPPPSPIASGRRSSVTNNEILTDFLEHSLTVPDLVLPDHIFPRQKSIQKPPKLDYQSLISLQNTSVFEILDTAAGIGCFELVNHGVPGDVIQSVLTAGARMFKISPEKKAVVARSPEKVYGFEEFEEFHEEDERERNEEFVWCKDEGLRLEMEGIWPLGYSNFSEKMERLLTDIEKMAEKIVLVLQQNSSRKSMYKLDEEEVVGPGSICCYLYKHCRNIPADQHISSLRHDVIRMLIGGSESHGLCLHLCNGASEFHVYSKKGWISFCPDKDAIIITFGDKLQAWSDGQYKHVMGRPIFKGEEYEDSISMAILYSPTTNIGNSSEEMNNGKTISLGQQAILALLFTLVYQFFIYVYNNKS